MNVPGAEGFHAAVLISEGEPGRMIVVDDTVRGNAISFGVPGKDGWTFSGHVTSKNLNRTVTYATGGVEKVALLRRCGHWDR